MKPFTEDEMNSMKAASDSAKAQFGGKAFASPYGWAGPAIGIAEPKFVDLENAARLSHLRGYYRWASHAVHADASGARHNIYERAGTSYRATGRVNFELAEPGHMALISLHQCTIALLFADGIPAPKTVLVMEVMQQLLQDAGSAFHAGFCSVFEAERQYQARRGADPRQRSIGPVDDANADKP